MKRSVWERLAAAGISMLLAVSLTACGGRGEAPGSAGTVPAEAAAPTAANTAAPTAAQEPAQTAEPPLSEAEQIAVLEENRELWAFSDPYDSPWYYTYTDLDHNGRMEVIAATTQGTGVYTYAHFWEVTADGTGIDNCYHKDVEIEGPDDWPEIILKELPCYYDRGADRWYYPCEGITRSGAAYQYYAWYVLCLKDGVADWELLADKTVEYVNSDPHISYRDAQGNTVSALEYDSAVERRCAGMEASTLPLDWTQVEIPFEAAPDVPAEPVSASITITKNPSSEAIAIGGKTWFIAHADGAETLTWQLLDPDGLVYSLEAAVDSNPGLGLQALEGDTLAVTNAPLSLNGWGVQARFDAADGYALTEPAYLFVGDFITAYGEVIGKYRTAYESGSSQNPSYAWDNGISEIIGYSSGVGYALKDLDKNGIPELIIAGRGTDDFSGGMVYDLYTLVNGTPVQLAISQARNRYYLRSDNSVVNEGSGGAAYSIFQRLRLNGDRLEAEELLFTWPETDASGKDTAGYYYRAGGGEPSPDEKSVKLSEAEFVNRVTQMEGRFFIPQLTKIY